MRCFFYFAYKFLTYSRIELLGPEAYTMPGAIGTGQKKARVKIPGNKTHRINTTNEIRRILKQR